MLKTCRSISKPCCDKYDGTTDIIIMPETFPHYSKIVCRHCQKYLKWGISSETLERNNKRNCDILQLLSLSNLSIYDRNFLNSISGQNNNKLSTKQLNYFEIIKLKYAKKR